MLSLTCYNGQGPSSDAPLRRPFLWRKLIVQNGAIIQNGLTLPLTRSCVNNIFFSIEPFKPLVEAQTERSVSSLVCFDGWLSCWVHPARTYNRGRHWGASLVELSMWYDPDTCSYLNLLRPFIGVAGLLSLSLVIIWASLGSLSIHQQVWGSIHSIGIYPFEEDAFVKTYPFKKYTLSGSVFLAHREDNLLLYA